jgi:hypothetical protein
MRTPLRASFIGGCLVACGLAQAAGNALDEHNFVDTGDAIAEVVSNSGVAFSTMALWSAAETRPGVRTAAFKAAPKVRDFDVPCPGGGHASGTIRDSDRSGDLSRRDRFVTVFQGCVIDGQPMSGQGEFVVTDHRYEGMTEFTDLDFRFEGMGSDRLRWTGLARVSLRSDLHRGTDTYVVHYKDLSVKSGEHDMRWDFSFELVRPPIGEQVAALNGSLTVDGMRLRLRQDDRFVMRGDGIPTRGQLSASDEHGARMEVEAGRWRYAYRLYRAGNTGVLPDSSSQSQPHGGH